MILSSCISATVCLITDYPPAKTGLKKISAGATVCTCKRCGNLFIRGGIAFRCQLLAWYWLMISVAGISSLKNGISCCDLSLSSCIIIFIAFSPCA